MAGRGDGDGAGRTALNDATANTASASSAAAPAAGAAAAARGPARPAASDSKAVPKSLPPLSVTAPPAAGAARAAAGAAGTGAVRSGVRAVAANAAALAAARVKPTAAQAAAAVGAAHPFVADEKKQTAPAAADAAADAAAASGAEGVQSPNAAGADADAAAAAGADPTSPVAGELTLEEEEELERKRMEDDLPAVALNAAEMRQVQRDLISYRGFYKNFENVSKYESFDYVGLTNDFQMKEQWAITRTETRNLALARWVMAFVCGVTIGFLGFVMRWAMTQIMNKKMAVVQSLLDSGDAAGSFFSFWGMSLGLALVSTAMIFWQPAAQGPGVAEVKGYLNGTVIPNAFTVPTAIAKAVSMVTAVTSSLMAGQDPLIHIGAIVGGWVSQARTGFLKLDAALKLHVFRNERDRRDFISIGTACGMASIFNGPFGGTFFVVEEVGSFWHWETTAQMFFACVVSTATANFWVSGTSYGKWAIFDARANVVFNIGTSTTYYMYELLLFGVVGATGGLVGGLFVQGMLKIQTLRRKYIVHRWQKLLEMVVILTSTIITLFVLPYMFACQPLVHTPLEATAAPGTYNPFRFECVTGEYNEFATLAMQGQINTIKHLVSRDVPGMYSIGVTFTYWAWSYGFLMITSGATVAAGLVTPIWLTGACMGRLWGEIFLWMFPGSGIDPGVYAVVGAGAMMTGVMRMIVCVIAFMIEVTSDLQFVLPVMVASLVARSVANRFGVSMFNTFMAFKNIPYLPPEPATSNAILNKMRTYDIMARPVVALTVHCRVADVLRVCAKTTHQAFPVTRGSQRGGELTGMISRKFLLILLKHKIWRDPTLYSGRDYHFMLQKKIFTLAEVMADLTPDDREQWLDLRAFMNRAPPRVHENTNAAVTYRMFRLQTLRHLPVINHTNRCVGIITRKNLLEPILIRAFAESLKRGGLAHARLREANERIIEQSLSSRAPNAPIKELSPDDDYLIEDIDLELAAKVAFDDARDILTGKKKINISLPNLSLAKLNPFKSKKSKAKAAAAAAAKQGVKAKPAPVPGAAPAAAAAAATPDAAVTIAVGDEKDSKTGGADDAPAAAGSDAAGAAAAGAAGAAGAGAAAAAAATPAHAHARAKSVSKPPALGPNPASATAAELNAPPPLPPQKKPLLAMPGSVSEALTSVVALPGRLLDAVLPKSDATVTPDANNDLDQDE